MIMIIIEHISRLKIFLLLVYQFFMPGILGVFANSIIPPRPIKSSITPDNELFWYFDLEQKKQKKETKFLNNSLKVNS